MGKRLIIKGADFSANAIETTTEIIIDLDNYQKTDNAWIYGRQWLTNTGGHCNIIPNIWGTRKLVVKANDEKSTQIVFLTEEVPAIVN